uniref:Mannose-P-dolichol utilization defect 1 protein homolog n=1 Tax=Caenorhabditis tropicalis TaxID=1561998 RepID=A0A1I7V4D1_9PELO
MSKIVHDAIQSLFPGNCFEELLINFNFFHPTCPKAVLSRGLGFAITLGSILLFVPQILKIQAARSAQGISVSSQLLALVGAIGTASYSYRSGFVFSGWGDSFFVAVQLVIIILQIFLFSGQNVLSVGFLGVVSAVAYGVISQSIPMKVLTMVQFLGIPIVVVSKLLQIYQNYKAQSTGQLSLISVFLQFAGTVARVFTSIQDTGDGLLILSYSTAAVLNGLIFAQFFMYWSNSEAAAKKKRN